MFDIGSARRRKVSVAADSGQQVVEPQNGPEAPDWKGQLELIDIEVLRRLRAYPSDIGWDDLYATFGTEPAVRDNLVHAVHRLADWQWHLVQVDDRRVGLTLAGRLAADQLGAGLSPFDYRPRLAGRDTGGDDTRAEPDASPLIEVDSDTIRPSWGALAGPWPDYTADGQLSPPDGKSPWSREPAPTEAVAPLSEFVEVGIVADATHEAAARPVIEPDAEADGEAQAAVAEADTPPDNVRVFPDMPETTSSQITPDDRRAKVQMDVQQVTFIPGASGGEVQADVSSGRRKLVASWPLEGDDSDLRPLLDQLMVKIEQVAFIPTPMGGQVRAELRVGEQTFVSTCWIDGQNTATQEAMHSLCEKVEQELLQAFTPGASHASSAASESSETLESATYDAATPSWSPSAQ